MQDHQDIFGQVDSCLSRTVLLRRVPVSATDSNQGWVEEPNKRNPVGTSMASVTLMIEYLRGNVMLIG